MMRLFSVLLISAQWVVAADVRVPLQGRSASIFAPAVPAIPEGLTGIPLAEGGADVFFPAGRTETAEQIIPPTRLEQAMLEIARGVQVPIESGVDFMRQTNQHLERPDIRDFLQPYWEDANREQAAFKRIREKVLRGVRHWELPVEDLLEGRDVLLLGENHETPASLDLLARSMPQLEEAGVRVIGLEHPKMDLQGFLDWQQSQERPTSLWSAERYGGSYAALFTAARRTGIRILLMDPPTPVLVGEIIRRAARSMRLAASNFPTELDPLLDMAHGKYAMGFNEAVAGVLFAFRERMWADLLADAMGGEKAVGLIGDGHLPHPRGVGNVFPWSPYWLGRGARGDLARRLAQRSLKTFSVSLVGGPFTSPRALASDRNGRDYLYRLAEEAADGVHGVFVRTSKNTGVLHMGSSFEKPAQ